MRSIWVQIRALLSLDHPDWHGDRKKERKALKRVAAGAHPPTPLRFEPVKRPDDRADYRSDR